MKKYDRYFQAPSNATAAVSVADLAKIQSDLIKNMNTVIIPS